MPPITFNIRVDKVVLESENPESVRLIKTALKKLEGIDMKLSEVKAEIAGVRAQATEAFGEVSTRLSDMQKKIDDLIAGSSDPDVTDEAFLADLNALKTDVKQLADIVPNAPAEPPVEP